MKPGFVTAATYGNPPTEIPPADGRTSGRRRALAEWLASPQNPLTARVIVNRIWQQHFGRGIVATLDNFGKMGEPPTHPELLDWLAVEFMNRGWSIKQMHRLMMTSEAYQMASAFEDAGESREGSARTSTCGGSAPQRLDAEIVRDSILAASGSINLTIGGPPVFPPMPKELLTEANHGIWKSEAGRPGVWRRSVYVYRKRGPAVPDVPGLRPARQNVTAGARQRVDGADAGADAAEQCVRAAQAQLFADRVKTEAGDDPASADRSRVSDRADAAADARPSSTIGAGRRSKQQSLVDLTHVLLNLERIRLHEVSDVASMQTSKTFWSRRDFLFRSGGGVSGLALAYLLEPGQAAGGGSRRGRRLRAPSRSGSIRTRRSRRTSSRARRR